MKTKWIDEGWYSNFHDHHVLRCPFCESYIVSRIGAEPFICPSCNADMKYDNGKPIEMMVTHNDGTVEYITDIDSIGLLSSKTFDITYYCEIKKAGEQE